MALRLTFRCFILLCIFILFANVFFITVYFNLITFENAGLQFALRRPEKAGYAQVNRPSIPRFPKLNKNVNITCKINDPQAISSLSRMKTEHCQQKCIDVFCQRKPWPDRLTSKCSHYDSKNKGQLHSCHEVNESTISLISNKKSKTFNETSLNACVSQCLQYDYEYAAFQSATCFCINNLQLLKNTSSPCDLQCSNSPTKCPNQLIVYLTGLKKVPFFFPKSIPETGTWKPRIVFLLLVNGRSLLQVHRLLRNIYSTYHYYYIHVDLRHNYLYNELLALEDKYPNIKLAQQRFASIWGGSSLLTTILSCIQNAFNVQNWNNWDFILNLSETDFPIKPISDLERYLSLNEEKNFVKSHGKNTYDFVHMQAADKIFIECENHMFRIGNRQLIEGIVWDGGSDWFVLSRNFSHYITNTDDELLSSLKSYFRYSLLPAEAFFHIVLRNSEFCTTIVNNNLRVTNWNRKKGCKCQHKYVVDWCGCSPIAFRHTDVSRLPATQSKPFFFARKFEHVVDSDIIDFVEQSYLLNGLPLLEESVYLENVVNLKYEKPSTLPQSRLNFYKSQGQHLKSLIDQNCRLTNEKRDISIRDLQYTFEESNVFFKNNRFYGTLLKYGLSNKAGQPIGSFETIMRTSPDDALYLHTILKPKLKSLKVCSQFDVKEEIFRDFECFLDQASDIEVLHEWELFFGHHNLTFVFLDPRNNIISQHSLTINNTKSEEETIRQLFHVPPFPDPITAGVGKLIVLNQREVIGAFKYVIAQSEQTKPRQNQTPSTTAADASAANSTADDHHWQQQSAYVINVISAFVREQPSFFSSSSSTGSQTSLWNIHSVCFEAGAANRYENYSWQCNSSSQVAVLSCADVNWSLGAVKARYLLGSQ